MRASIKNLVEIFARTFEPAGPIYEFGSYQVEGQEGFADLRPYFPGRKYVGCDNREGLGVDEVLDLEDLLPDMNELEFSMIKPSVIRQRPRTVLCMDTLEHVEYPRTAITGIEALLEQDGIFLMSSVMNFPIHGYPDDYWRFTPSGFKSLLSVFDNSFVGSAGDPKFPHTVIGIGFKSKVVPKQDLKFTEEFMDWKVRYK